MKRIFTTTLLMLSAVLSRATHQNSDLLLSSSTHEAIVVTLDNEEFNEPDFTCVINDIAPGYHNLKISKVLNNPHARYPVSRVIYDGTIFIPEASRVSALVERRFRLRITAVEPVYTAASWNNIDPGHRDPFSHQSGCLAPVPMDCISFDQLIRSIDCKRFESSKFQVACQAAAANYFTSEQVAELATRFTFESTRLDFAKLAYARTLDKQRYFLVNDAFTFESSIDELNAYILYRS